jgi:perosamine synthetase
LIPVNEPSLGEAEQERAGQAVASGWISGQGAFVDEFEKRWAEVCKRKHGISVSSGTAALETAVHALGLPRGSEVIMPTFSMISCLAAVLRNGLKPVFVDADPETWCMNVDQVAEAVTEDSSAIMVVHIYGQPVDMDPILAMASRHGLMVIEDAAEAHGARYRGRICGSFGDASVFSFYSNKIVTTGEGGMVVCDDDRIAQDCRDYRNLYFDRRYRFLHGRLGHNFRLTNVQAAIGCVQIERLGLALERKHRMARLYDEMLADLPDLQLPPRIEGFDNVHWVYGIVLGNTYGFDARELRDRLRQHGVDSRLFFLGMHEQPVARQAGFADVRAFPVAERLARRGLYLPSGLALSEAQIETVASALRRCLGV